MPSSSSMSRSRSPLMCKNYDEVFIDGGDDQLEKEEEEIKVMDSLEKMQRETIQLDVGGYNFKTTKKTLTRIPSKLSKLIAFKSANASSYFLDRDPKHFNIILSFLRNGKIEERTLPEERGSLAAILTELLPNFLNYSRGWSGRGEFARSISINCPFVSVIAG
uniref:BTB domain-containing protein n=1 Tax=Magallana gigas TaxID=29159 RepID=A0A8W8MH13_MAGGI